MHNFFDRLGVIFITLLGTLLTLIVFALPMAIIVGYIDIFKWILGH